MAVDFSFGQVEAVCAALNDISSEKRTAFTSRLKHLMKAGIITEDRPGRGKAAKFTFSQLMKMVIGVELLQAGTPPILAAKLVKGNWAQLRIGVHFGLYNEVQKRAAGDPREETYWLLAPEALRDLSAAGEGKYDHYEAFESIYKLEDLMFHISRHEVASGIRGHYRRQLILNGTAITRAAAFLISAELNIASIQELQADIYAEIAAEQAAFDKLLEEVDLGEVSQETADKISKIVPIFSDHDYQWESKIAEIILHLTPIQIEAMSADLGSQVEIYSDDIAALRKLNLMDIQQGELVITDLGHDVAAELRKRAGKTEQPTETARVGRTLERAAYLIQKLHERKPPGEKAMVPVEIAVLAAAAVRSGAGAGQSDIMVPSGEEESHRGGDDGDSN